MNSLFAERTMLKKLGVALAGGVVLMMFQGVSVAGIKGTKHDLSSSGAKNTFEAANGTSEICAFCHTPHGGDTTAPAPLWNRKLGEPSTFTTYAALGTSSMDGAVAPVGSVSLACLSCHDGTQAMNTTINQAGSGGYNADGATQEGTWSGPASGASPVGSLSNAGIALIGTDLKNDHPVGVQYGGGGFLSSNNLNKSNQVAAGSPNDSDFVSPRVNSNTNTAAFWVETGSATSGRQKTDLVLYTRTEASVEGGAQPFVECATCHDPHTDSAPTFLRISNRNSELCLACHTK